MVRALLMSMPDIYPMWTEDQIIGPSMGLASIAGNCSGHEVFVADLSLRRGNVKGAVDEALRITNPNVVGLSFMTFQYPTARRVAQYIRETNPDMPIVAGGYHLTILRADFDKGEEQEGVFNDFLKESGYLFDIVFAGEAEHTFNQYLNSLEGRQEIDEIPGISFRKNERWIHTPRTPAISRYVGLNTIKPPKRDSRIWDGYHFHSRSFDTAETSRGCQYACKFCCIRSMLPRTGFAQYDLNRVFEDLGVMREMGVKSVFFTDDNPAMDQELFEHFLRRTIQEGLDDIAYSGFMSTERAADSELTSLMKRAGWSYVFLAVESPTNKAKLDNIRKKSSEFLAERAIRNLYESDITVIAGLVIGTPNDAEDSIRRDIQWLAENPVDSIIPQFLMPHVGTVLRREMLEEGLIVNKGGLPDKYNLGWSAYNGAFAVTRTRSGLEPRGMEATVLEEARAFERRRLGRLFRGELIFPRNNFLHARNYFTSAFFPTLMRIWQEKGLSWEEKAELERERRIAVNQFNI